MRVRQFSELIGHTFVSVEGEKDGKKLIFRRDDGKVFTFWHRQDCCESVLIEDICGDIKDLIGSPILVAEEVSNLDDFKEPERDYDYGGSRTWTFYKFATAKGYVDVRWLGESNGYYSESVSFSGDE